MKILLINPNTSTDMTERMVRTAADVLAPDVELVAITATRGMPYIASRAEAVIAGTITLEMLAEHHRGTDAVVIAAFGDPGLIAARELFEVPITAMAESAILTACMLGKRFAILTFSRALVAWFEDAVALCGLEARCGGIRVPDVSFQSVTTVQHELENELIALAEIRDTLGDRPHARFVFGREKKRAEERAVDAIAKCQFGLAHFLEKILGKSGNAQQGRLQNFMPVFRGVRGCYRG